MTIVSEMFDNGCRKDVRPGGSRGPLCAIVAAVCTVGCSDSAVSVEDSVDPSMKMLKPCDDAVDPNIDFPCLVGSFSLRSVVPWGK